MSIKALKKTIEQSYSLIIASHVDPEGDAIGSSLALYFALKNMGKKVCVYNESGVPRILRFLPGKENIVTSLESVNEYDAIFVVDCGDIDRLGKLKNRLEKLKIINIDHHSTNNSFGHLNFVDKNAAAAGEVVYDILKRLNVPFTKEIAINLYTAVVVDTGSFRYASTTPKSFKIAAELLTMGVDPWEVAKNIYENFPFERMKLLGDVLQTMELVKGGLYAFLVVTKEMLAKYNATEDLTEGFVNFGRAVDGVEVSVLFKETGEDQYKLSFRSKGDLDVAKIAQRLGGGGHKNAAGCKLKGSLIEVKQKVIAAIENV
ncbi:MAG: bifunctional oligoribonuclease/PAP phosphatase NrnA [bacterium]